MWKKFQSTSYESNAIIDSNNSYENAYLIWNFLPWRPINQTTHSQSSQSFSSWKAERSKYIFIVCEFESYTYHNKNVIVEESKGRPPHKISSSLALKLGASGLVSAWSKPSMLRSISKYLSERNWSKMHAVSKIKKLFPALCTSKREYLAIQRQKTTLCARFKL